MQHIEKKPRSQKEWFIMLLIAMSYIVVVANIQGFKALFPLVMEDFMISRAQVGIYSSIYLFTATLLAISSGQIVDRIGAKKGLFLSIMIVGIMMLIHTFSPYFSLILCFSFLVGIGFSFIVPSVNKGIFEFAEPSKRSFYMGIVHGGSAFGGFLGSTFLPFFGEMAGWRIPILFLSLFSVLIGLLIYRFYHLNPVPPEKKKVSDGGNRASSLKENLFFFMRNYYLISFCLMGTVLGISVSSISVHYTLFMTHDLNYTPSIAGLALGIYYLGGVIGQPGWGLLIENFFHGDRRKGLFVPSLIIAGLALFLGLFISRFPFPFYALLLVSFLLGFCTMGMIATHLTAVSELVPKEQVGVVTGFALIFSRIGMILAPPLFGIIADLNGSYSSSWVLLGSSVFCISIVYFCLSGKYVNCPLPEQSKTI